MVRVPRVEHGGRTRNPANWLIAAALAMENSVVTAISEIKEEVAECPPSYKWAGSVIRKLWPERCGKDALDSRLTIPNPAGLSCYDALMYALDALVSIYGTMCGHIKTSKLEIDKHKGILSGLAGEYKDDWCDGYWIHFNHVQRAGVLLYLLEECLHDISDGEELLKRFRLGIIERVFNEHIEINQYICWRSKSSKPPTLAARKMVSVPRVEHGGHSRNPVNRLGAAESFPSDILAEAGLVIRKLLPDEIASKCIEEHALSIPNPGGLSNYDAIMYAINALPEETAHAVDAFRSLINRKKNYLSRRLAGEWIPLNCRDYNINYMQRAGVLLYILQEGLHNISNEKDLLERFRSGIFSGITDHLVCCYLSKCRRRLPERERANACAA